MEEKGKIEGGYVLRPRLVSESKVGLMPPHVREIFEYLVRHARYSDGRNLKRGQLETTCSEVLEGLCWYAGWRKMTYKKSDYETAMRSLRKVGAVKTTKTVRGVIVTICNYDFYQNSDNYDTRTGNGNGNGAGTESEAESTTVTETEPKGGVNGLNSTGYNEENGNDNRTESGAGSGSGDNTKHEPKIKKERINNNINILSLFETAMGMEHLDQYQVANLRQVAAVAVPAELQAVEGFSSAWVDFWRGAVEHGKVTRSKVEAQLVKCAGELAGHREARMVKVIEFSREKSAKNILWNAKDQELGMDGDGRGTDGQGQAGWKNGKTDAEEYDDDAMLERAAAI